MLNTATSASNPDTETGGHFRSDVAFIEQSRLVFRNTSRNSKQGKRKTFTEQHLPKDMTVRSPPVERARAEDRQSFKQTGWLLCVHIYSMFKGSVGIVTAVGVRQ